MKLKIIFYIILSGFTIAQADKEKSNLEKWKFLAFQGANKVYYLPTSLVSVGDIFRIKLLRISEKPSAIPYTIFVEDYDRSKNKNRVVQVSTFDKDWHPVDHINIDRNAGEELWVQLKKGSEPYRIYERLLISVQMNFDD